jgi:hypothetical protein
MIPFGFIGWSSPIQPDAHDAIVAYRLEPCGRHALVRGVARELAAAYGESLLAWRRDAALPALPGDGAWQRFPDVIPRHGQQVVALFLDTIGWRALGATGMTARRYDGPSLATCVYHAALPFGVLVGRRALPGHPDCSDRLRWAAYGWREAHSVDVSSFTET